MAKNNAAKNYIDNVHFETGQAETVMGEWVKAGIQPDVIVVDPPRKFLDDSFIESIIEANPEKLSMFHVIQQPWHETSLNLTKQGMTSSKSNH